MDINVRYKHLLFVVIHFLIFSSSYYKCYTVIIITINTNSTII